MTALGSPIHLKHSLVIEYGADRDKPLVPRGNVLRGFMVLAVDAVAIERHTHTTLELDVLAQAFGLSSQEAEAGG